MGLLCLKTRRDIQATLQIKCTRTGVIYRVVTPKDKERNPSPLTKRCVNKKLNVIHRSKYKMKENPGGILCPFEQWYTNFGHI